MKKLSISVLIISVLVLQAYSQEIIRLYTDKAPGSEDWNYKEVEFSNPGTGTRMIRNVVDPTLEVFVPDKSIATGTAVIICPGGGNVWLSYESEGTAIADWLVKKGVTAFVLKYRLTKTPEDPEEFMDFWNNFGKPRTTPTTKADTTEGTPVKPPARDRQNYAGADGLRAMQYVRAHSDKYGINSNKVGIIGFSAGAGVTMHVILNSDRDEQPNFAAPIYGGWLRSAEVPEYAPPLFILCAADDRIGAGSTDLYKAWREAGKSAELHIYSKGGHGFGMDKQGLPVDHWIERFYDWLTITGF